MFLGRKVVAILGEVMRGVGLAVFAIAIGQLGDEMSSVPALCPSFTNAHAYGSGRPADLSGQRLFLLGGKPLAGAKDEHRKLVSFAVNIQILCGSNDHHEPLATLYYGLRSPIQTLCPRYLTSDF